MGADRIVNAAGLSCPLPIIELAKAVRGLEPGRRVLLLATDPAVEPDVRAWCEATGHVLEGLEKREGRFEAMIRLEAVPGA